MKYKVFISVIFAITMVVANSSMQAYKAASIHETKFITDTITVNTLKGKLKKAVTLIETKGNVSFSEISKMNNKLKGNLGLFVIDPETGHLLVSPPKKTLGQYPLISEDLNGKVLARYVIKNELLKKNGSFIDTLKHAYGLVYKNYFAKLAVTPRGKLYVVAIAKNSASMQKLFIIEVVDEACTLIKKCGIKEAVSVFNQSNSLFKFKETYIFVYGADKDNKGVQLCNPNYPQYTGKNILTKLSDLVPGGKEAYKILENKNSGWFIDQVKNPETGKLESKDMYIQKVNIAGKSYIVGSGVYIKK